MATPNHFPTTAWSLLDEAGDPQGTDCTVAMNRLIVRYWRPVYFFVRARGYRADVAEDLTQEFFLRLLERNWIARADAQRGRFRTFLLTVLTRFLSDHAGRRAPRQARFDRDLVPVSTLIRDPERSFEPPDNTTPEELFMRGWAQALVDDVRGELEMWCRARGRPDWYEIFSMHHFPDTDRPRLTQEQLADRFRCSRDQIRYAIDQTNAQFAQLFRAAVSEQVNSPEELDSEIREIEMLLTG